MRTFSRVCLSVAIALAELCGVSVIVAQSVPADPASTIVLPDKIPAGEKGTLAVLDLAGRLVTGATVQLPGGVQIVTDSTGRGTFSAPAQAGILTASVQSGRAFACEVTKTAANPSARAPRVVALSDRFTISDDGFSSDADRNRVTLGGERALVLASSSAALVALPNPRTLLGNSEISVEVEGRNVFRAPVIVVSLAVMGPSRALTSGKKGVVQVAVSGTSERVIVEVQNLSPEVVKFPRGNVVQFKTSGGNANVAKIEVVGVKAGDYAVSARLAPTDSAEVKDESR